MAQNRIRQLRSELNITQAELGKQLDLSTSTIGMYENGQRTPDPATLEKMADFFSVSIDYLVGRSKVRNIPNEFLGIKLAALRGDRTYQEYSDYLRENGNIEIEPFLLEIYENGSKMPDEIIVESIADVEGITPNYFYENNNASIEKYKTNDAESVHVPFMSEELRSFFENPENLPYLEFAYTAYKKGISVDLMDKIELTIKLK